MQAKLKAFFDSNPIKGFLEHEEGLALYQHALNQSLSGPCLEVGSYCGKSTVFLGWACREHQQTLYAVDHHRGSEEHQVGEEYHDRSLFDEASNLMDSFPTFRHTLDKAHLEETVVPLVASSELARRNWQTPLSMVFIDGGHSDAMSLSDCEGWAKFIIEDGVIAIHDIFERPEEGGQGPYQAMKALIETGQFFLEEKVRSLVFLRKRTC